jgi:C1A family cysteine protease
MNKARFFFFFIAITFLVVSKSKAKEKDLRPLFEKYGITVYNQGERGTCSVFAVTGLLEFEYAHVLGETIPLSVEYLNWASNKITRELSDGSYFSDAIDALNKYGICSNDFFPYYILNYTNKVEPSDAAIKDAKKRQTVTAFWIKDWDTNTGMTEEQISQVKNQIMNEHPVAIGFRWPKKNEIYRKMINGIMIVPPEEGVYDGHSVIIVGFKDNPDIFGGGYFIFKNSHGKDYGENGYGKMPYAYVQKYANDGVTLHLEQ